MRIPLVSRYIKKRLFEPSKPVVCVRFGKAKLRAELAKSTFQKTKGLMFRKSLSFDEGMLFDFRAETLPVMWMFGMLFPIDMLWLDDGFRIVHIEKGAKPFRIWRVYAPKKSARYVLEVKSGFCEKNKIEIGQYAEFC